MSRPLAGTPSAHCVDRSVGGVEVLKDGTELLASSCLVDVELHLAVADDPAFMALEAQYAELGFSAGWSPPGMQPDHSMH